MVNFIVTTSRSVCAEVVLIMNLRPIRNANDLDVPILRRSLQLLVDVLPIKVKAVHICGHTKVSFLKAMGEIIKAMVGKRLRHRMVLHRTSHVQDIPFSLEKIGMEAIHLPTHLGGSFGAPNKHQLSGDISGDDEGVRASDALMKPSAQAA